MKFGEGSAHVHHFKFKFVGGKKLENSIPENAETNGQEGYKVRTKPRRLSCPWPGTPRIALLAGPEERDPGGFISR